MTDNDIIKALEHCADTNCNCEKCSLYVASDDDCQCARKLKLAALDLINRTKLESKKYRGKCQNQKKELALKNKQIARQKAEIETLKEKNRNAMRCSPKAIRRAKAEAIKEFAERLKEKSFGLPYIDLVADRMVTAKVVNMRSIDNLVKEMVGDV